MEEETQEISYTIDELRAMIVDWDKEDNENMRPLKLFGKEIYTCIDPKLPGEIFKKYKYDKNLEASNYGRIRYKNEIIPQKNDPQKKRGLVNFGF